MSTDPRTPAEVADWLTEHLTDVTAVAFRRYPYNAYARREDERAQMRLLVEAGAEHLRQFDRERERYVDEIARLRAELDIAHATIRQEIAS